MSDVLKEAAARLRAAPCIKYGYKFHATIVHFPEHVECILDALRDLLIKEDS